ncbi:MAG: tRNA 4-thiouridine(8) synthase ThiI [SAR202 cluster bacterium]|nr:tRNA 4-thiouridine(8) synthase ThiI [SAR202 cluster bacterium]|tara:strand:+ start:22491 stop:23663 length:1173 start_codon:yes stop_codon:yes gene_type:complete
MAYSQSSIMIRVHEIALKGKNRPMFLRKLESNLKLALKDFPECSIKKTHIGVGIADVNEDSLDEVLEKIKTVFGVVKFYKYFKVEPSIENIENLIASEVPKEPFKTFRITAKRGDKNFPLKSPDMDRHFGNFVQTLTGADVSLYNPELNIFVEVLRDQALLYFKQEQGPGGLPVGVSGKVLNLLSGGIDSPVAAQRMMKRGCRVLFMHFHSFPLVDGSSREKAQELVSRLNTYQFHSTLFLVPFADVQKEIILSVPPQYRIIIYRRFMTRIAEKIALSNGAQALVTGESLGQVGSQTLENINTIRETVSIPILSPLIGMDKQEIINEAKNIGTYETSIIPDEDCCSLFVPKHPATQSTPPEINLIESNLDVEKLINLAIENIEVQTIKSN